MRRCDAWVGLQAACGMSWFRVERLKKIGASCWRKVGVCTLRWLLRGRCNVINAYRPHFRLSA